MAAPSLAVNREAVRVLVLAVGVREAARQMGLNEDTVSAWSARGKWLEAFRKPSPTPPKSMQQIVPKHVSKLASNASTAPEALENVLKRNGEATRLSLSKAARKGASALAAGTPDKVLRHHKALQSLVTASAKVDGWGAQEGNQAASFTLNLGVVVGGMGPNEADPGPVTDI